MKYYVIKLKCCFYLPWGIEEIVAELLTEALERPLVYLKDKAMSYLIN